MDPFDTSIDFSAPRYYSHVPENQRNTYSNVDRYDLQNQPYYANHDQNTQNVPTQQNTNSNTFQNTNPSNNTIDVNFISELEKQLGKRETQSNLNTQKDSPKKQSGNALIPALRPPPPNLKKSSPKTEPEMVLSPSGLVTPNTWEPPPTSASTSSLPTGFQQWENDYTSEQNNTWQGETFNPPAQESVNQWNSSPSFHPAQETGNQWNSSSYHPAQESSSQWNSSPSYHPAQESNAQWNSSPSYHPTHENVLRTNVLDVNASSELFENREDNLTMKLNQLWLDRTQTPVEPTSSFPANVDMTTSILQVDPWQQNTNLNSWDVPDSSTSTTSNAVEIRKTKKKRSNTLTSVKSNNLSSVQRNSLSENVNSTCPTISQAFFKSVNSKKENSYQPLQNGIDKRKSLDKNRLAGNYVIYKSSPNLNASGSVSGKSGNMTTSIRPSHPPLVGLSGELRMRKLEMLLNEMPDAGEEERITALQHTGWEVPAAVKCIKLERLLRLVCL